MNLRLEVAQQFPALLHEFGSLVGEGLLFPAAVFVRFRSTAALFVVRPKADRHYNFNVFSSTMMLLWCSKLVLCSTIRMGTIFSILAPVMFEKPR